MEILWPHIYTQGNIYTVLKGQFCILHYILVSGKPILMDAAAVIDLACSVYGNLDIMNSRFAKQLNITVKLVAI